MSELNFTNYDFDELVVQLTNRLKERNSWKDTNRSSTGSMLIELFAATANLVLYYVERRAEESYILTAKNRSSIINLVRLLNYFPKRKVSSTGVLRFTLDDGVHTSQVFIPKYTECTASNGKKFVTSEEGVILPGQTYVDINAIQGELIPISQVSTGETSQEYNIKDTSVENTNLTVNVAGVDWTQVTSFIDSTTISNHYILRTELDDTVTTVFGDSVFGKAPAIGEEILIQYIKSDGVDGNIYELDKVTTLNDTILDVLDEVMTISVTNSSTFLGGDDIEGTEEIRNEAPQVFATGDRAVTKGDFISILSNYAGISDSNAWGENEETPPNVSMYNQVKLCILLQNWTLTDADFKTDLETYLQANKALMTVRYSWVDPEIIYITPVVTLKVVRGNSLTYVQSQVVEAIENQFILGTTAKLGEDRNLSNVTAIIEAVTGVSYSRTVLKIRKDLTTTHDSDILEVTDILPGSVEIYINDVLVAIDDETGGFIDMTTDYVMGDTYNSVDYETGIITIDTYPEIGEGDTMHTLYQQDADGDIGVEKNQICKLYEVDVTSISYAS